MTVIYIPEVPDLHDAIAQYSFPQSPLGGRQYYYHALPLLLVVVVLPEANEHGLDTIRGKFECSIGNHDANAPIGYTSPTGLGLVHSKITLRHRVPDYQKHGITWDELMRGSEILENGNRGLDMPVTGATKYNLWLPSCIDETMKDLAARRGYNHSQLIQTMIHYWLKDNI